MARVFYIDDADLQVMTLPGLLAGEHKTQGGEPLEVTALLAKQGCMDEAVAKAMESDLVLSDYNWNIGRSENGIEFAKRLRVAGYQKPIILYSGDSEDRIKQTHNDVHTLGLVFANKATDSEVELYALIQTALKSPPNISGAAVGAS